MYISVFNLYIYLGMNEEKTWSFSIAYRDTVAEVKQLHVSDNLTFNVSFQNKLPTLVVTVAIKPDGTKWWTSIPQGRQIEAEEIGKLIASYIRRKRKELE